jgi:colicin import membrane protein
VPVKKVAHVKKPTPALRGSLLNMANNAFYEEPLLSFASAKVSAPASVAPPPKKKSRCKAPAVETDFSATDDAIDMSRSEMLANAIAEAVAGANAKTALQHAEQLAQLAKTSQASITAALASGSRAVIETSAQQQACRADSAIRDFMARSEAASQAAEAASQAALQGAEAASQAALQGAEAASQAALQAALQGAEAASQAALQGAEDKAEGFVRTAARMMVEAKTKSDEELRAAVRVPRRWEKKLRRAELAEQQPVASSSSSSSSGAAPQQALPVGLVKGKGHAQPKDQSEK